MQKSDLFSTPSPTQKRARDPEEDLELPPDHPLSQCTKQELVDKIECLNLYKSVLERKSRHVVAFFPMVMQAFIAQLRKEKDVSEEELWDILRSLPEFVPATVGEHCYMHYLCGPEFAAGGAYIRTELETFPINTCKRQKMARDAATAASATAASATASATAASATAEEDSQATQWPEAEVQSNPEHAPESETEIGWLSSAQPLDAPFSSAY